MLAAPVGMGADPNRPPAFPWMVLRGAVKTLVVMVVPLVGILLAQPLLRLGPETLGWAKIASLAWAMLYLLVTVDPALRDKVETIRSLATTVRDVGRPPPVG